MTMYYAAVKYAVDDSAEQKIKALREGLESIAMALIEEFGQSLDNVRDALEVAENAAEWSVEVAENAAEWSAENV